MTAENTELLSLQDSYEQKYGFRDPENYVFKSRKGLSREIVEEISFMKQEPRWMLEKRLEGYEHFISRPMPHWGPDLNIIDFEDIYYFVRATEGEGRSWDEVPEDIKNTFDRLGIPEAEQRFLAGVGAQYESEMVYHKVREDLKEQGVIFLGIEEGLRQHPDLFRQYFGTVIPYNDNKFSALNTAVWSGGSFVYVPPGVEVQMPLQAYFRINTANMGQFERSLIIVDEGAKVHYVEGCTAPVYSTESLHSGVIEIIVKEGADCRYTTIQNWANNVYNLVTQRSHVYRDGKMAWVDGNLGSRLTMKYPSVYLMEEGAHGEILSVAFARRGQNQDAGGKALHLAPNTSSQIISKSISMQDGRSSYRGLVHVAENATNSRSNVVCDALLLHENSKTDTYPYIEIDNDDVLIGHEASVTKVSEEQLFYLQSRGLSEDEANLMIVNGFIEPFVKELPMEYAVELNRLVALQMEGSIG